MSNFIIKGTPNKIYDLDKINESNKRMAPNNPLVVEVTDTPDTGDTEGAIKLNNDSVEITLTSDITVSDVPTVVKKTMLSSTIEHTVPEVVLSKNKIVMRKDKDSAIYNKNKDYYFDRKTGKYKKK